MDHARPNVRFAAAALVAIAFAACSSSEGADLCGEPGPGVGGSDASVAGSGGSAGDGHGAVGGSVGKGGASGVGGAGEGGTSEAGSAGSSEAGSGGSAPPAATCGLGATVLEEFSDGQMVGCPGTWSWEDIEAAAATRCGGGSHLCSAQEWVTLRAGKGPGHHYWTSDNLKGWDGPNCHCTANASSSPNPCGGTGPMHVCSGDTSPRCGTTVCASVQDSSGNTCCWIGCGLSGSTDNQYFGGCMQHDDSAGVLCCRD